MNMGLFRGISVFWGHRRRLIRRLAALCLIAIGVHAAGDVLDDAAIVALDTLDLWLDRFVQSSLDALSTTGLLSSETATTMSLEFAEWMDVETKQNVGRWLALFGELAVLFALLDFVWGARESASEMAQRTVRENFKRSARELGKVFRLQNINLEILAVIPVCLCLSLSGALWAGRTAENLIFAWSSELPHSVNISAAAALAISILLIWRFVPDLLDGAAQQAGRRSRNTSSRLREFFRGTLLFFVLLPISVFALFTERGFWELTRRIGSGL